jgi:hypothetical protein
MSNHSDMRHRLLLSLVAVLLAAPITFAKPGVAAEPVRLSVNLSTDPAATVSPMLMGFNASYFNDLDEVWQGFDVPKRLRQIGTGVIRFPGGEEISRYHWEQPGVTGYVDAWNLDPRHRREYASKGWNTTAVEPDQWDDNDAFMSLDDYLKYCQAIGTEPLVGVNMSSGIKLDRLEDSLAEAERLVRHCEASGVKVRQYYLDNETWLSDESTGNYHHLSDEELGRYAAMFSRRIKAIQPEAKTIINPLWFAARQEDYDRIATILEQCGDDIDYLDLHIYPRFQFNAWDKWVDQPPSKIANWKQRLDGSAYPTHDEALHELRGWLSDNGWGHIDVMVLEWNAGQRAPDAPMFSPRQIAMMQGELMLQLLMGDAKAACMWPLFWGMGNGEPRMWEEPGFVWLPDDGRSALSNTEPYEPTETYRVLELFTPVLGGQRLTVDGAGELMVASAVRDPNDPKVVHVLVVDKESGDAWKRLDVRLDGFEAEDVVVTTFAEAYGRLHPRTLEAQPDGGVTATIPPVSISRLTIRGK